MTTIQSGIEADISEYVGEVERHLAGLPGDERTEMLEDLRNHLAEVAVENPDRTLTEAIGPPSEYAAELLASAGVTSQQDDLRQSRVSNWQNSIRQAWNELRSTAIGRYMDELMPSLRPAWWVLRAYIVVIVLAQVLGSSPISSGIPVPYLFGSRIVGLVTILGAVLISIALGRSKVPTVVRLLVSVGNIAALLAGIALLQASPAPQYVYADVPAIPNDGCLTNSAGQRITNIYAYDVNGALIDRTLLYDQSGKPIDNLCLDYDSAGRPLRTEYEKDLNGAPVYSLFPRRQSVLVPAAPDVTGDSSLEATTPSVEKPVTPPAVVLPRLAPPSR